MKNDNEMKTITIRQGSGDDALEMTVQVTQAEFEKMEELRSKNPQKWPEYSLELVKEAREAIAKPYSPKKQIKTKSKSKKRSWLWIVSSIIIIAAGIAIWYFTINTSIIQGNDLAFRNLKGSVKAVYTLEFDAIKAFDEGVVLNKPSNDDMSIRFFDSLGNQTESMTIKISNSYPSRTATLNQQGLPLKEYIYAYHTDNCTGYFYYEYNPRGEKIQSTRGSFLGIEFLDNESTKTYSYKYDLYGRIILMKSYDSDGAVAEVAQTQYDALGRITNYTHTNYDFSFHQEEYEYTENGFNKRSASYFNNELQDSSNEQWIIDRNNHRNDKYVYDEKDAFLGKISYYYDTDSSIYMTQYWDESGNPNGTIYRHYISTQNDSVIFFISQIDSNYGFYSNFSTPAIYFKRPIKNGFEKKEFDVEYELTSSLKGVFDRPFHQLVTSNDGSNLSIEYDKKNNPKSVNYTFSNGKTIITKYFYRGRERQWEQIETYLYDDGRKETTTNTYSHYNLLSSIKSSGIEKHWEYDEKGEEISYKELNGGNTTTDIRYSDYNYDKYGNWIRRTNYNVLTGTYTVTERCIEYY